MGRWCTTNHTGITAELAIAHSAIPAGPDWRTSLTGCASTLISWPGRIIGPRGGARHASQLAWLGWDLEGRRGEPTATCRVAGHRRFVWSFVTDGPS